MDESAFYTNPSGGCVLAEKGKPVYGTSANSDKENITTLITINANGEFAPPLTIYKFERIPKVYFEALPTKDWGIGKSKNVFVLQCREMVYLIEMHKITILQMIGYGDRTRTQAEVVEVVVPTNELAEDDFDRRILFCEQMMQIIDDNTFQIENVLFSDESTFTLHGHVNRLRELHTQNPEKIDCLMAELKGKRETLNRQGIPRKEAASIAR
ncbi:hypothetical protein NQ318_016588 [Aromia moschata]|uniref:Uncharacterized protein n=1 Tax=Aromia moschata TaxID=1265417 RepID=A0AAV8YYH4_9CUCU|nr:hypothetical protein NQ318_016588 [Aromia moschata]